MVDRCEVTGFELRICIAAELRVSRMTIYRLLESGDLASVRVGHSYRVTRTAVDAYLRGSSNDDA